MRMLRGARFAVLAAAAGIAAVGFAGPASAHVTVSAPGATSGGSDQIITFRVPTESATASTVELQVQLPTNTPIATVLLAPHTGWTDAVTTVQLTKPIVTDDGDITQAVSVITWKADSTADGIKPGHFDQFTVIAGLLPKTSSLTFPAIQTYSDGSVVKWIQVAAPGSNAQPDHPAPVLQLTNGAATAASTTGPSVSATPAKSNAASKSTATTGLVFGILGTVLGAAAIVLITRVRRSATSRTG